MPTDLRPSPITDDIARKQIEALRENCKDFGVTLYDIESPRQGIVHVIGPELGYTQPGQTIVCGDSHTSTHGAFGALAFGIGTSEVEHVLATQTLRQQNPKTMEIRFAGDLPIGVGAKDMILATIGQIGVAGGVGRVFEYTGPAIRDLNMEGRMTVCNMTIEGGARAGMIAPDDTTFEWLEGRPYAPKGQDFYEAVDCWKSIVTDEGASYDSTVVVDCEKLAPYVSWGTNPGQVARITDSVPDPADFDDPADQENAARALEYMGLDGGTPIQEIPIDRVFIGSCTNGRLEDLRSAARVVKGKMVAPGVRAMVVPGSTAVKLMAEREGLDEIFKTAGFEWRESGCSMCLGMNPDILAPGRAVRVHVQPEFRRPAGQGRPHPLGESCDGRRGRDRRPLRGHQRLGPGGLSLGSNFHAQRWQEKGTRRRHMAARKR